MAKPIPKKRTEKVVEEQMALFRKATEARYRLATEAYKFQDARTRAVIDRVRDRLSTMSTGQVRVFPNGKQNPGVVVTISQELIDQNVLYMAIEIFKDLAFMDVQVENFQFPKVYCAECGEKITPPRKKVKK